MSFDLRKYSLQSTGTINKEHVYQRNGARRAWFVPTNPRTEEQQAWRYRFAGAVKELSDVGPELRATVRDILGPSWNRPVLHWLLRKGGMSWEAWAAIS